jgi:hypothetical protein
MIAVRRLIAVVVAGVALAGCGAVTTVTNAVSDGKQAVSESKKLVNSGESMIRSGESVVTATGHMQKLPCKPTQAHMRSAFDRLIKRDPRPTPAELEHALCG